MSDKRPRPPSSGPGLVDASTGLPVDVADPAKAEQDLLSGALELRTDVPTTLVDPRTGAVVDAEAANVQKLLSDGYRLASSQEVAKEDERQQYDTLGSEAKAFGAGALRGATFTGSDALIGALGGDDAKQELLKLQEYSPVASGLGEATGVLGSMAVTGGIGGAIGAPARGVMQLGQGIAEGVEGAVAATSVLGKAGTAALAYGLSGAVEGGLYGAAKTATDDYLRDHEITAERILAGAGTGALWGGALGGAMGAGGSLLSSGAKKLSSLFEHTEAERQAARQLDDVISAEATANQEARAAVEAGSDARVSLENGFKTDDQIISEIATAPSPESQGIMDQIRALGDRADAPRKAAELQQKLVDQITDDLNKNRALRDVMADHTAVSMKHDKWRPLMEVAPPDAGFGQIGEKADAMLGNMKSMLQKHVDSNLYEKSGLRAMKEAIDEIDAIQSVRPQNAEEAALLAQKVDDLKRAAGKLKEEAGMGKSGDLKAERIIRDQVYAPLREFLEDETIVGRGWALEQKRVNAAYTRSIDQTPMFRANFELPERVSNVRSADGWDRVPIVDRKRLSTGLRSFGGDDAAAWRDVENSLVVGAERDADLMETLASAYDVPESLKKAAAEARVRANRVKEGVRDIHRLNEMSSSYRDEMSRLKELPAYGEQLTKVKTTIARAAASWSKSDARAAGRVAAESGADVHGQTAVKLATQGEKQAEKASNGLISWITDSAIRTGSRANKAARSTAEAIAKAGPLMGVQMDLRNPATYEAAVKNIGALQDPKSDERKIIRARTYGLRQSNPPLADALEQHTQNVANFLAAKAGALSATPGPGDPFGNLRKPRHDPAKAAKLARYMDAAQNPSNAMERLANGDIRREDIETLQALYPRLYGQVVERVMSELGSVEKMPSYQDRLKLGHLLNAPVDPSMTPERVAALQQVAHSNAQPNAAALENGPGPSQDNGTGTPSSRRPPKMAKLYATRTQEVAGSRFDQ